MSKGGVAQDYIEYGDESNPGTRMFPYDSWLMDVYSPQFFTHPQIRLSLVPPAKQTITLGEAGSRTCTFAATRLLE